MPRVTQKDIAHHLGVSQSLVAAVLGNRAGVWVSQENRQRIQQAARDMHYRPNAAAQSLRSGHSRMVGLVVTSANKYASWEVGHIIAALADFTGTHNFDLKFKFFSGDELMLDQLAELVETGWAEMLILTGAEECVEEQGTLLEKLRVPFVVIGDQSQRHPDWYQADFDHNGMMFLAVAHLAALGHSHLAYLGHQTSEHYENLLERGFQVAAEQCFGPQARQFPMGQVKGGSADEPAASATHFVLRWMELPPDQRPTAFVFGASDDRTWRETELALQHFGFRFGSGKDKISAAGLHHTAAPLLFGQAQAFLQTDLGRLTAAMCEHLLMPLLNSQQPESRSLRLCPALQPLPTLDLGKQHFEH